MKKKKFFLAVLIFLAVFSISVHSINTNKQLGRMSGLTEEYIDVAKNLLEYGMEYPHDEIVYVYRPPGYIVFLKTILRMPGHIPRVEGEHLQAAIRRHKIDAEWRTSPLFEFEDRIVYLSQAVLFGLTAVVLFLLLSRFGSERMASYLSLAYGLNVYLIILAGIYHYPVLHLFFVMASCYATVLALEHHRAQRFLMLFSGVLWGLTTLIRPTTLIFPAFFLMYAFVHFKKDHKRAVQSVLLLVLGMLLTIAPQTINNYSKTKRFIPVNAQGWIVFWANTVEQQWPRQNYFNWFTIWYGQGMPVFQKVTQQKEYLFLSVLKHNLALEEEFRSQAFRNIKEKPQVLIKNTLRNFLLQQVYINSVIIKMFQAHQKEGPDRDFQKLVEPGASQDFHSPAAQVIFELLHYVMLILSVAGLAVAFKRKEDLIFFFLTVYACFVAAHSLTLIEFMHYYIKMPFLYIFAGYAIISIRQKPLPFLPQPTFLTYGNLLLGGIVVIEMILLYMVL